MLWFKADLRDFPDCPVVKTARFQRRGRGFSPQSGTKNPHALGCSQRIKEIMKWAPWDPKQPSSHLTTSYAAKNKKLETIKAVTPNSTAVCRNNKTGRSDFELTGSGNLRFLSFFLKKQWESCGFKLLCYFH